MNKRWPTMKTKELVLRDVDRIAIDATVSLDNKFGVVIHFFGGSQDDWWLSVIEAERFARVLTAAADVLRAKQAATKAAPGAATPAKGEG